LTHFQDYYNFSVTMYRKGRLTTLLNTLEILVNYYLQEQKKIQLQFKEQIAKQLKLNSCLEDTGYKQDLCDALNKISYQ